MACATACSPSTSPPARAAVEPPSVASTAGAERRVGCRPTRDPVEARDAERVCDLILGELLALGAEDRDRWPELYVRGCAPLYSAPSCRDAWRELERDTRPLDDRLRGIALACRDAYCPGLDPRLCDAPLDDVPAALAASVFAPIHEAILACDHPGPGLGGDRARLAAYLHARVFLERGRRGNEEIQLWIEKDRTGLRLWTGAGLWRLGPEPAAPDFDQALGEIVRSEPSRTTLVVHVKGDVARAALGELSVALDAWSLASVRYLPR